MSGADVFVCMCILIAAALVVFNILFYLAERTKK